MSNCITEIDMLNPDNMIIMHHDIDRKTETCLYCGVIFKNFEKFMEQQPGITADLNTGEVVQQPSRKARSKS